MPCTLEPWEIEVEEANANERKYGLRYTDARFTTAVACAAMKHIKNNEPLPQWAEDWWKDHQENCEEHEA